jgi:hypothetical protein
MRTAATGQLPLKASKGTETFTEPGDGADDKTAGAEHSEERAGHAARAFIRHVGEQVDRAEQEDEREAGPRRPDGLRLCRHGSLLSSDGHLEFQFRSSQDIAAGSDANFGIKGALASYFSECGFEFEVPMTNSQQHR